MAEIHETINRQVVPIENIDYIGHMERPYEWGYAIYLKTGNKVWVSRNDSYVDAENDRKLIINKLKNKTEC